MAVVERLVIVSPSFRGDTGLSILTVIVLLPKTERPEREEVTRPGRRMERARRG
jgi:hypothetical protein